MKIEFSLTSILTPTLKKDNIIIHFLVGLSVPMLFDDIGTNHNLSYLWIIGLVIILLWITFKEFYWNPRHETRPISGGWYGDVCDALEYLIGTGIFLLVKFG